MISVILAMRGYDFIEEIDDDNNYFNYQLTAPIGKKILNSDGDCYKISGRNRVCEYQAVVNNLLKITY